MKRKFVTTLAVFFCLSCENKNDDNGAACSTVASYPTGVSSAPPMTFYYGATSDNVGTPLTATGQISGLIAASGCGPFGVWESGNGGEVATELEFRFTSRRGVFAMADGVVSVIQSSSAPLEAGEVEGIWVRYGDSYLIKYVHVVNAAVSVGQKISSGQRIGETVLLGGGQYFMETELRQRSGGSTYSKAWSSLLTNAATFNSLFGSGNCGVGSFTDSDGSSATTASNWLNVNLPSGQWNVSGTDQPCAF